jgi:hypothetical protein
VKDVSSTEFKRFVLNEMIKIVIRMNSMKFTTVYWMTCDKYYHIAIWVQLEMSRWTSKCRKKPVQNVDVVAIEDRDKRNAKHFNLLKPLTRFYHLINISGIVTIWLVVNLIIAVLVKYEKGNESISATNFLIGVIISTILGHILIMSVTKLLHVLYMKNIEDAFDDRQEVIKFHKKHVNNETQRSEAVPMLASEYNTEHEKFETRNSLRKWEESSKASSK